jgi:dihydrofolate reductase
VVSRSGRIADWNPTSRLGSLDAASVAQLKDGGEGDLVIYGSIGVIAELHGLDAVDEYQLLVHPTAIGKGKPLFGSPTRLRLRGVEPFPSGVTLMRYSTMPLGTTEKRLLRQPRRTTPAVG